MSKFGYILGSIGIFAMFTGFMFFDANMGFSIALSLLGMGLLVLVAKYEGYL